MVLDSKHYKPDLLNKTISRRTGKTISFSEFKLVISFVLLILAWYRVASDSLEGFHRETLLHQEEEETKRKKVHLEVNLFMLFDLC